MLHLQHAKSDNYIEIALNMSIFSHRMVDWMFTMLRETVILIVVQL